MLRESLRYLLAHAAERASEIDEARAALGEAVEQSAALASRNDAGRAHHAAVLAAWFDLLTRHGRAKEAHDVAVAAGSLGAVRGRRHLLTYPGRIRVQPLPRSLGRTRQQSSLMRTPPVVHVDGRAGAL